MRRRRLRELVGVLRRAQQQPALECLLQCLVGVAKAEQL